MLSSRFRQKIYEKNNKIVEGFEDDILGIKGNTETQLDEVEGGLDSVSSTSKEPTKDSSWYKNEGLINFLRVSADDDSITSDSKYLDHFNVFIKLVLKYGLMVVLMTMNFVALSLSLNCNADQEFFQRIFSAVYAFFFGFIYLTVNYYTYKVLVKGKICKLNKEKLFPFSQ